MTDEEKRKIWTDQAQQITDSVRYLRRQIGSDASDRDCAAVARAQLFILQAKTDKLLVDIGSNNAELW